MDGNEKKGCCFTGHRKIPEEQRNALATALYAAIEERLKAGCRDFYAGGALGFDYLASEAVLFYQKDYPELRLHLYLPYPGYDKKWTPPEKQLQKRLEAQAAEILYLSELPVPAPYYAVTEAMYKRNRAMVEKSSHCIAYCTKKSGGSYYTLSYAQKQGLVLRNLGLATEN